MRNHSFREAPWTDYHQIVDDLMDSYGVPDAPDTTKPALKSA